MCLSYTYLVVEVEVFVQVNFLLLVEDTSYTPGISATKAILRLGFDKW